MNLQRAYDLLRARWPGSWSIDITVWHYEHTPEDPPALRYRVWDGAMHQSYEASSLEAAMEQALGCDADLAAVDAQLKGFAP